MYEHYAISISENGWYDLSSWNIFKLFLTENDLLHYLRANKIKK